MNKQSFLANRTTPVVQFSKLDQNNKAQFLQFLIRNNISFNNQTGKQNFTAKITLKNIDNNKNNNINNNKNNKKNIKNEQKQQNNKKNRSPLKQINKLSNQVNKKNATISPFSKKGLQQKDFSKTLITKINNNKETQQKIRKNNKSNQIISRTPEKKRNNENDKFDKSVSIKKQKYNTPRQTNSNIKNKQNNEQKYNHTPKRQKQNHKNYQNNQPLNSRKQFKINNNQILVNNNNLNSNNNNCYDVNKDQTNKMSHKNQNKLNNKKLKITDKIYRQQYQQKQRLNQRSDRYNKGKNHKIIRLQDNLDINNKQLNNELTNKFIHSQSQDRITLLNKYSNYFNLPTQYCASNPSRQRPICWSLKQLQRFLDQFYDDSFTKNTQQILIGSKKLNQSLHKQSRKYCYIAQTLIKYLNRKFNKVQKVIQYNLVNFIYSIAYYIYQSKPILINQDNSTMIGLKIFQSFLMMKYQFQDYLFFLFVRNILKNDFKKMFITIINQVNKNQIKQKQIYLLDKSYAITKKQITRFLKHVIGQGNQQILQQYHQMISDKIKQQSSSSQIFIQINKFVKIILDDYQIKRWSAEQSQRNKQQNNKINKNHIHNDDYQKQDSQNQFIQHQHQQQGSSLQSTFSKILSLGYPKDNKLSKNYSHNIFGSNTNIIAQESMQQLTFGQDTKQFLKLHEQEQQNQSICQQNMNFWSCSYQNQQQKQQIIQMQNQKINSNELYGIIVQKIQRKTQQLIQILTSTNNNNNSNNNNHKNFNKKNISNQFQSNKLKTTDNYQQQLISNQLRAKHLDRIQQLLLSKTINLFFTVIQMNKVKWLKQLQISTPSQQDIQKVQQLQLMFRKIKQSPTAKDIAQFCKNLLTVKQITNQLSKFFI